MYEWDAKEYHEHSSEQQKWAEELIGKIKLNGNERVLDIGCGDGKVTSEIAKCLIEGSILGIDSSEEMIFLHKTISPRINTRISLSRRLMPGI